VVADVLGPKPGIRRQPGLDQAGVSSFERISVDCNIELHRVGGLTRIVLLRANHTKVAASEASRHTPTDRSSAATFVMPSANGAYGPSTSTPKPTSPNNS